MTRQLELSWFLDFNPIHGCIFCFFLLNLGLTSPVKILFPPENSHSTMIHGVFSGTLKACQLPLKIRKCRLNLLWGLDWGLLLRGAHTVDYILLNYKVFIFVPVGDIICLQNRIARWVGSVETGKSCPDSNHSNSHGCSRMGHVQYCYNCGQETL